jgi:hypothetical protein
MAATVKHLLIILALVAIGGAQLFGVSRGYWCDCPGGQIETASSECIADECHPGGAHADGCQPGDDDSSCQQRESGHSTPGHKHTHKELRAGVKFQPPVGATLTVPVWVDVGDEWLQTLTWIAEQLAPERNLCCVQEDLRSPPSMWIAVVHATVLLV